MIVRTEPKFSFTGKHKRSGTTITKLYTRTYNG